MESERTENEMHQLERLLGYSFKDISHLANAMECKLIPGTDKYTNGALATVGDAVLKLVLTDHLHAEDLSRTAQVITDKRETLENNEVLYRLTHEERIIDYAYNDSHFKKDEEGTTKYNHIKVPDSEDHTPYLEAIIAAIYYDCGFDETKKWILDWLLPKLKNNNGRYL